MTADILIENDVIDHRWCWLQAGRDGACLDRDRTRCRVDQQLLSIVNLADGRSLGSLIVAPGRLDQCQLRRRSAIAAPIATTKSP